jgi:hypothetical protein
MYAQRRLIYVEKAQLLSFPGKEVGSSALDARRSSRMDMIVEKCIFAISPVLSITVILLLRNSG